MLWLTAVLAANVIATEFPEAVARRDVYIDFPGYKPRDSADGIYPCPVPGMTVEV
ncbi:hypothetical protein HQ560_22060 [bacterium]|nr:hypothetical protein [bacterium]